MLSEEQKFASKISFKQMCFYDVCIYIPLYNAYLYSVYSMLSIVGRKGEKEPFLWQAKVYFP